MNNLFTENYYDYLEFKKKEKLKNLSTYEINKKWKNELLFRKKFYFEIDYYFNKYKKQKIFLHQIPSIMKLEIRLLSSLAELQKEIFYNISKDFYIKPVFQYLKDETIVSYVYFLMSKSYFAINKFDIRKLIFQDRKPILKEEIKVLEFYEFLNNLEYKNHSPVDIQNKLWEILSKTDNDVFDVKKIFSSIEKYELYEKNFKNIFFEKENDWTFLKCTVFLYDLIVNKYFKKNNYKTLVLYIYNILSKMFFNDLLKMVPFVDFFDQHSKKIKESIEKVNNSKGDITFLYICFLELLFEIRYFVKNNIKKLSNKNIFRREINIDKDIILMKYPFFSKKVSSFLANSEIGKYYVVTDFIKITHCSYETARTSLNLLVKENFFKKEKVGKKYVYKRTSKKIF